MSLFLSHQSALRYWLTKQGYELVPDTAPVLTLARAGCDMREVRLANLPFDYSSDRPLHILVPSRSLQRSLKSVRTHVCAQPLPPGSFNELAGDNFVSSPELTFLQVAARRPITEAIEIGCYLCGGFSITDEGRDYMGQRLPLTTPDAMREYLERLPGAYGVARALRALDFVVPRAASPMEVLLVMALRLPPRLGGWALPPIEANTRIEVSEELRLIAGTDHFVGDIYIPSVRGNMEYESNEFHTGSYRLDHTQTRRNVLEAMDVKTVAATWGQIKTFSHFEQFLWMARERFGIPHRSIAPDERGAQIALYEHLTDPTATLF